MKEIMTKINEQKELLIFHTEKVQEMIKAIDESTSRGELIDKFFIAFADAYQASNSIKQNSLHLLVDRIRQFS